jgi:tRNA uridine 5-carbamoylmethylation protein Kti12
MMRGLPGSGKSTEACQIAIREVASGARSVVICSTDNFHMVDGEYRFNKDKLGEYHKRNQLLAYQYMLLETELVIIDNTNVRRRDMTPYRDEAEKLGYNILEVIVGKDELFPSLEDADPCRLANYIDLCADRNTHGVPREAIEKMARRFQK